MNAYTMNKTCTLATMHLGMRKRFCTKAGNKKEVTFVISDPHPETTEGIFSAHSQKESRRELQSMKRVAIKERIKFKMMSSL